MSEFNFTNRRPIPRESIGLTDKSTTLDSQLVIESLELDGTHFPITAKIWFTAQRGYSYQRFELGTPTQPLLGRMLRLDSFETEGLAGIKLRLLIVDEEEKILAASSPFMESTRGGNASPLLDMRVKDIGHEVWRLDFEEEDGPLLLVNSNISDPEGLTSTPAFLALALPSLVKQIAVWLMTNETDMSLETAGGKWTQYFKDIGAEVHFDSDRPFDELIDAADTAAQRFATKHDLLGTYLLNTEQTLNEGASR